MEEFKEALRHGFLIDDVPRNPLETPEAVDLARYLHANGYRLRFADRCLPCEATPVPGVPEGQSSCRVIIMCPNSGIKMQFDAATSACKCPPPSSREGHGWDTTAVEGQYFEKQQLQEINRLLSEMNSKIDSSITESPHVDVQSSELSSHEVKSPRGTDEAQASTSEVATASDWQASSLENSEKPNKDTPSPSKPTILVTHEVETESIAEESNSDDDEILIEMLNAKKLLISYSDSTTEPTEASNYRRG